MLTEADIIEAINYYRAGDDDTLLELFQRFDFYDWETPECPSNISYIKISVKLFNIIDFYS